MHAETVTKLSLARYARLLGINPLHFAGVTVPALAATSCESIWFQHSWQESDAASREDVARCIAEAEAAIENILGYRLLPSWETDEWHETIRAYRPEWFKIGINQRGFADAVKTDWGQFLTGGICSRDLIARSTAIVWSDGDGDGYKETGTITFATTALNGCELRVFYPGKNGDPEWEIRPVTVVLGGGAATVTFRRELCVLESIAELLANRQVPGADGMDDNHFLDEVDVYRVYNDPQRQVQMLWEPSSLLCGGCGEGGCPVCAYSTQYGCLHARGRRDVGLVAYTPADWSATDLTFINTSFIQSRQPDAVRLWYYAGLRGEDSCSDIIMSDRWARAVAYYATALLDRTSCSCNAARFDHWQADLAFVSGSNELGTYNISQNDLDNPFGTRRGMVHAWKMIQPADAAVQAAVLL